MFLLIYLIKAIVRVGRGTLTAMYACHEDYNLIPTLQPFLSDQVKPDEFFRVVTVWKEPRNCRSSVKTVNNYGTWHSPTPIFPYISSQSSHLYQSSVPQEQ